MQIYAKCVKNQEKRGSDEIRGSALGRVKLVKNEGSAGSSDGRIEGIGRQNWDKTGDHGRGAHTVKTDKTEINELTGKGEKRGIDRDRASAGYG